MTSTTSDGKLKSKEVNNRTAHIIACPQEVLPMVIADKEVERKVLSAEEIKYIRNAIAEGLARSIVLSVTKRTEKAVDESAYQRYPSPAMDKGGQRI